MNKINNNKAFVYIFSLLISLVMLIGLFSLATTPLLVSAETTSESFLNFNQINQLITASGNSSTNVTVNNEYTFTTTSASANAFINVNIQTLDDSHLYWCYSDYTNRILMIDRYGNSGITDLTNGFVYTRGYNKSLGRIYIYNVPSGTNTYHFNIIDLTLMFGAGNEPTKQEILDNKLFPTFYSYTRQQPIINGPYTDYINGYTDALAFTDTIISGNNFLDSVTPLNIGNTNSTMEVYRDSTTIAIKFSGYLNFAMQSTIPANTPFTVNFETLVILQTSIDSYVGYMSNGALLRLGTISGGSRQNTITLTAPVDINSIVFWSETSLDSFDYYINSTVTYKTQNVAELVTNAFNKGGEYYQIGQPGYELIYNQGFEAGQRTPTLETPWTFVSSTFTSLGGIFAIEFIPGVPLWVFVAIPLLFGLIVFIYKLAGGN